MIWFFIDGLVWMVETLIFLLVESYAFFLGWLF